MAMLGGDSAMTIIIKAKDEFSKVFSDLSDKATKSLNTFSSKLQPAADASKNVGIALGAAATAVGAFGVTALKSAASAEQTMIALETMLGSAEKAKTLYSDLVKFAAKTPFELTGLETATKQLLAYGFTQEELLPNLKSLGDIASGVGMDKLPNLILAFGQVKAATKLTGMELRQFTEAGVPLLDELSKVMGKPVSAIQEMVSAGEIGFPVVQKALSNLSGEGGRFNDLMTKQSESLGGMWSNLQDAWEQFLRGQGAKLLDWGKQFVAMLIDLVQNGLPPLITKIEEVVDWFGKHKEAIIVLVSVITSMLIPSLLLMAINFAIAMAPLIPWMIGGAMIGALIAGIYWIVKNWEMISAKAVEIWNGIADFFKGIWESITGALKTAWDGITNFFSQVWDVIVKIFETMAALAVGIIITIFEAMGIDIIGVFKTVTDFFTIFWQDLQILFTGAITLIQNLWTTAWTFVRDFIGPIWDGIKSMFGGGLTWINTKFTSWIEPFKAAWGALWGGLTGVVTSVWDGVKKVITDSMNWIIGKINTVIDGINSVIKKGADVLGTTPLTIGKLPTFEHGGIVPGPEGMAVPIMAHGQERVVPASQASGSGGGAISVVINNPVFRNNEDERRLKEYLDGYFRPLLVNHKLSY